MVCVFIRIKQVMVKPTGNKHALAWLWYKQLQVCMCMCDRELVCVVIIYWLHFSNSFAVCDLLVLLRSQHTLPNSNWPNMLIAVRFQVIIRVTITHWTTLNYSLVLYGNSFFFNFLFSTPETEHRLHLPSKQLGKVQWH